MYLGLGYAALFVTGIKAIITLAAHSSIPWDKSFYKYKVLHPIAWVLERLISTPATHHAHHADTHNDGVGYYKGNFGNMHESILHLMALNIIKRKNGMRNFYGPFSNQKKKEVSLPPMVRW